MSNPDSWPSDDDVPGFHATAQAFLSKCEAISSIISTFTIVLSAIISMR